MKTAKLICLVFAASFALSASGFCQQVGRFQIVTGIVQHKYQGDEKVILKIDTLTGETWKFIGFPLNFTGRTMTLQELQDATLTEGWTKLADEPGNEISKFEAQVREAKAKTTQKQP